MRKMNVRSPFFLFSAILVLALCGVIPFLFAQPGGHPGGKDAKGEKGAAGGPGAMMAMKPTPVLVAKVSSTVPDISREYRGSMEAVERVRVIARVSGRMESAAFQEGDIVNKGDLLFNIEETEYVANLRAARAQAVSSESLIKQYEAKINEINAKIRYAETNYKRFKQLYENNKASSEDDVDNALSTYESEKAQLEAAKATLTDAQGQLELAKAKVDLAEFDLSHTKIHSPIKGRIGRLSFTPGNYITPTDGALVTIAQMDPIYIRFSISETDFVSLFGCPNTLCETTSLQVLLADNTPYPGKGKIKFIDNQITKLDTLQVWAEFENPDGLLNPGGIAKVILTKPGEKELPSIAASAILHDKTGEFVYVLGKDNMTEKRPIELGAAMGNTQCVEKGLDVGETVLIGGTNKIMPGMPVEPVFEGEETSESIQKLLEKDAEAAAGSGMPVPASPEKSVPAAPSNEAPDSAPNPIEKPAASEEDGMVITGVPESATPVESAAPKMTAPKADAVPLTLVPSGGNGTSAPFAPNAPEKKGENR